MDPDTGVIYNQGVALGPSAKLNIMKVSITMAPPRFISPPPCMPKPTPPAPAPTPTHQTQISPAGELLLQRAIPLPGVSLVHDFVLAGRFVVVFLRSVRVHMYD